MYILFIYVFYPHILYFQYVETTYKTYISYISGCLPFFYSSNRKKKNDWSNLLVVIFILKAKTCMCVCVCHALEVMPQIILAKMIQQDDLVEAWTWPPSQQVIRLLPLQLGKPSLWLDMVSVTMVTLNSTLIAFIHWHLVTHSHLPRKMYKVMAGREVLY